MLQCYNKGCLQKFDPDNNSEKSCIYHPGYPVFHDVYKKWSCCGKKTTDFTVFLSTKGCCVGHHNPDRLIEPPKSVEKNSNSEVIVNAPKPPTSAQRLEPNHPRKKLPFSVSQSLQMYLMKSVTSANSSTEKKTASPAVIPVGTQCKRPGCTKTYDALMDHAEPCWYHAGTAIFHEGMKYWSCCQRKTSDFETFLQQAGCTSGLHVWKAEEPGARKEGEMCRYDFYQTAGDVFVTVYARHPAPAETTVECDPVNLYAHVELDDGAGSFDLHVPLWGAVDVDCSAVTLSAAKLEIRMKKREPVCWPRLNFSETDRT